MDRDIFNKLELYCNALKQNMKDYFYNVFMLGKIINVLESDGMYKEVLDTIDIEESTKELSKNLNVQFEGNIEKFEKVLYQDKESLLELEIQGNTSPTSNASKSSDVLYHLQNYISTGDELSRRTLIDIQNRISKIISMSYVVEDQLSLKYSYCCGCGTLDMPTTGFDLYERDKIKIPLCKECHDNNIIDDKKVINLYFTYAVNLEKGLNRW